jgi:ketosteroid isomerase-like protein
VLTAVDTEGARYQGSAAWTTYFEDMDQAWKDWRAEDHKLFDGGDDRVAGVLRIVGTGRHSDAQVELAVGLAYFVRDGQLWRMRSYADPTEALEAVGLQE